eukprot:snap_masked-scaffold_13-processed-gene-9.43-mRNA-1 protein AED:1.00 eAED:1.00 QI:0/-1/0/0/-1/1/1/0/74
MRIQEEAERRVVEAEQLLIKQYRQKQGNQRKIGEFRNLNKNINYRSEESAFSNSEESDIEEVTTERLIRHREKE